MVKDNKVIRDSLPEFSPLHCLFSFFGLKGVNNQYFSAENNIMPICPIHWYISVENKKRITKGELDSLHCLCIACPLEFKTIEKRKQHVKKKDISIPKKKTNIIFQKRLTLGFSRHFVSRRLHRGCSSCVQLINEVFFHNLREVDSRLSSILRKTTKINQRRVLLQIKSIYFLAFLLFSAGGKNPALTFVTDVCNV